MTTEAQRLKTELNKYLGANVVTLGSNQSLKTRFISTGLLPFDVALGGGLPRNRYVVLTGAYSTLKSYVGLNAIRQAQLTGGVAAIIDTERAFDPDWAEAVGVDLSNLIVWPNPDDPEQHTGEEGLDTAEALIRNGIDICVLDSIAATLPQAEGGKRLHKESVQPGRQAALFSLAFRKLTAVNRGTAVLMVNQLREQIGVTFGNPEKAPGGRAAGFYASMIANIRQAGKQTREVKQHDGNVYKSGKETIGQTFRIVVEKSKLNKPFREVIFDWDLETGEVDHTKFLFTQGVDLGLVTQKGQSWEFDNEGIRGKDNFLKALSSNEAMRLELENQVRTAHGLPLLPLPGRRVQGRKKAEGSKPLSSSSTGAGRTRVAGRAASASTARTQKSLRK